MASDFLKKKAQEQAASVTERFGEDAYGGTKWRESQTGNKDNEGGSTPPSTKTDQYQSTKASDFLSRKAEEQAASVTERFGEDAYGGTKWRNDNSALSSDSLSQLLQRVQGLEAPGPSAGALKTSGGYYSRPTAAGGNDDIFDQVSYLTPALREYAIPVETAASELQQAESRLKIIDSYLARAQEAYSASPSEKNADVYNQIASAYEQAYEAYTGRYETYYNAYTKYRTAEDQVSQILSAYQKYAGAQQAAFDDWRGTIRDAAAVKQEINAVDAQISALKKGDSVSGINAFMGNLADNMARSSSGLPATTMQRGTDHSAEIQQLEQMKALLQEELDWSQYYQYNDLRQAEDFAEKSRYIPQERTERRALDIMLDNHSNDASGWEDPLYEYINGNEEAGAYISNAGASYYGPDNAIGNFFGRATENKAESQQMTEQEVATFNYLYATQGKDAAHAYYEYLLSDLNYRHRKAEEEKWAAWAKEHPVGSSVFSAAMSPIKGLSYLGQFADYTADRQIDQNAAYNKFSYIPGSVRNQVTKQVEDKWGAVGSFAYQTGMSMADFLLNAAITGGNEAFSLAIMGTGAAADATIEAKDRGLSDDQSFALGTIAGAAEIFTERFSVDALLNPNILRNGTWEYIAKNAVTEGLEEAGSDLINLFADILISKDQSEWRKSVNAYMESGLAKTKTDALWKACVDQFLVIAADMGGGAISGGIMAGVGAGFRANRTTKLGKELGALNMSHEDIQKFIDTGLESDRKSDAYHIAKEMQKKIKGGKKLSNYDLARLYQANVQEQPNLQWNQTGDEDAEHPAGDTAISEDQTDDREPQSVQLPTLEDDTQEPGFVTQNGQLGTQNGQNVTDNQASGTDAAEDVPLSVAERLRQEQNLNGGTQYESTQKTAAGPAAAQPAGEHYTTGGTDLLHGGGQRYDGTGTGEQAGSLAGRARQAAPRNRARADAGRAAVRRTNLGKNLRLEKVSSIDLGLQNGTDSKLIQVIPQEHWDNSMAAKAEQVYQETGKQVTYILGGLEFRNARGGISTAKGVIFDDRIIAQANHSDYTPEQIADHEAYHGMTDPENYGKRLNDAIVQRIREEFSKEEFEQVLSNYIKALRNIYDLTSARDGAEYEQRMNGIIEELLADAHAGMNMWGAGAAKFTDTVNRFLDDNNISRKTEQENGTEEPTGPPSDRFSYAGENEARDAASRRQLTAEQRRSQEPARADDRTVFVEDIDDAALAEMDAEYGPQLQSYFDPEISAEEMEDNIRKATQMDPVAQITGEEFAKSEKDLVTQVEEFFAQMGNTAYNAQLGDVVLDRRGIKSDLGHGMGRKKAAAFAAVPDVIEQGLIVDYQQNWKDRGYDTAVVAAPITIGTEEHIAAVVLTRSDQTNRFYVHEVLTTEETENGALPFKTGTRKGNPSGNTPSVISILERIRSVKNQAGTNDRFSYDGPASDEGGEDLGLQLGDRYSVDDVDSHGHDLTQEQREYFAQSQARDSSGRLLVLYHQTDNDFTIFDTRHHGAGSTDGDTPFGIFLKQSAGDIGLTGKKQMALYANITNPLRAANREDLARQLRGISENYAAVSDRHNQLDAEYHEKFEQAKKAWRDYIIEWRAANPGANRSALYDDPKFNELYDAEDAVIDEWTAAADQLSARAKEAITEDLRKAGYDGIFLENDVGSWGRRTDAIIALDPEQVKNITNKKPTSNPDIRYSVDDADDQVAIGDLQAELYQLQHHRRSLLEADTAYAAAADNLRYANTFTEKVAARKAMAAAAANIDTAAIDQRISDLNEQISEIRNRETRQHREDQEKYSGTKTPGYSTMPDTRLKDLDQDYMKAVRSGDRARMAELVEQAAEAAMPASVVRDKSGRLLKTYHHTGSRFTVFDRNMARTGTEMDGFFFAPDPDSTSEYGSNTITAYLNITKLAMDPKLDRKFNDSGTILREKLAYQGYDGMARTENGEIYEYMTFDPEQIKSADPVVYDEGGRVIPLSERFNFHNPDIRYSVDEGDQDPAQQKPAAAKKKTRPVAESRPLIAKKDLRSTVLNLFSIPSGQRTEVGAMIDSYADRLIKNGSLTEEDRKAFFDRMYDAGVMVMPADEYSQFARSHIADGRIYVSDSVKADFGDDWADIRRRAFAAGVYLVNDRSASGIDQWNATLSAEDMLPGLFDPEETDQRAILERIIQVAEEGKDEHLSLAEYTSRLSQREGISEDEFLDNMERQLDWALRTFAEKAQLEVHLRDRTGRKIAQEREKGAERMTRQQAREAQRRADERQARKDSAKRAKDRKELQELQQRTLKQLQWLSKNRNRAPEELKATWDEVLGDIDIYAVSAADEMRWSDKHNATWKDLAQMYKDAMKNDPNFLPSKELERIVARLDGTKIADMDVGALQDLYKAAIGLRTEFYNRNNVINDKMQRLFAEVYTDAKREIESAPGGFTGNKADKFLNLDQLTPMNVLQRMVGWDPDSAFYSMAKQLERGERDMRAYSVKAQKMLQDFLTEYEDWVKIADGQGKDAIWYEVEVPQLLELGMGDKPIFGPTVKVYMTPAQKVHMYLESKNLDNLRHMTGGRTFVDKELYSQGKRQEALSQGRTIKLAPETVRKLVSDLTAEEMELAQVLDRYYNTFATQEINRVSNILYGYDKAMGKNYAPIYTNRNYTKTEFGVFDTTAEGVGNLKGRQYAVNPSYNISAFDAFERHVDQTARFCGMAIPARNWTTLMNWREKNNSTGDVITHKWGEESKRYITDLITTLQGGDDAKSDTISSGLSKLQSNYISAIFGANPSIVLKQLGSIPLAGAYLDFGNLPKLNQMKNIDRNLIGKYTQELEWRTMGYSMPETKQLKNNPSTAMDVLGKVADKVGGKIPISPKTKRRVDKGIGLVFGGDAITAVDGWAASTLWPWAENKVRREHPELAVGTKAQVDAGESAFYKKVAEEFENAVSRSQSVSDEIHQGSLRKSKSPITRAFTMFRSDSAQTYNALRQKIGEARYYMRTGAEDKVIQTAKKAAGTAFVAMLLNAAWSEAVSFLMALWKNKGKYYRDDDDELTFGSVAGEMTSNVLGSFAGVVTGGEELVELIGNIITGDKWYGIETPGMEQLNDLLDTLIESGSGMRDLVAGGWDVLKNGGNLGEYFGKHSGQILGSIKDLAEAAAMYLPGLPASNLEAYLVGAMKWISPELGTAYDDLFSDVGKSDLAGMEGSALESRISGILSDRRISESDDTAAALAALYEAGYKTAIPSDTPTSVSIDGEKHSMGAYQQQAYDTIWGGIVADALDDMVASDSFAEADPETQAKMLSNLYTYAAERAKAELFDEYEMDSGAAKNAAVVAAGATVAECITWNTITSEMKSGEKSAELASWDLPESAKREIFLNKISDSREDSIAAFKEAGLSFDQFLTAYSRYGEINNMDLKAGEKAVEFAHWVNDQGYAAEQAAVVKDELTYFNMTPATSGRYDELVGSGMDPDDAYDLTGVLNELQPEEGEEQVTDIQKWRTSVDFSDNVEDQLTALSAVMTNAQFQKVEIANNFGVTPDAYVTLQEIKPQYDADGNGSYKNDEIRAAVDGLPGYFTTEQKAVLWQLATGSTSSKNNPYSRQVGQQVLDARAAAKAAAQDQTNSMDEDSFSQELMKQLMGGG